MSTFAYTPGAGVSWEHYDAGVALRADPDRPDPYSRRRRRRRWVTHLLGTAEAATTENAAAPAVTIRPATPHDARQLELLAESGDRHIPDGDVLVAEVDTEIIAALPLDGRPTVTDSWHASADVVELLELRSEQIKATRRRKAA